MINIDSQLQQRKDEITKKVNENNNHKEEIKIMNKEQLQEKEKAASERESNQNITKYLEKAKGELEKQKATFRIINLELETKLHALREKPYFLGPGISQKAQKDHVSIIFPSTFWQKKRPYFPSPKSSKQELLSNQ